MAGCGNIFQILKLSQNVYVRKTKYWQEKVETHSAIVCLTNKQKIPPIVVAELQ